MRAQCSCGLVWLVVAGRAAGPSKLLRQLGRAANRVVGQLLAACLLAQPPTLGGQSHLADLLAFLSSSPCSLLNIPLSLAGGKD